MQYTSVTMKKILLVTSAILLCAACTPSSGTTSGQTRSSGYQSSIMTEVVVNSPGKDSKISSPLIVTGKAKGNWFFEANIPISIEDDKGNLLAEVGGEALGDWMTSDFVDFKATITFSTTAKRGRLIIRKDNPSGLPENDASFEVPVTF